MIKSLSGKTENINAALKSSDAEIRAKLKKIKEVEIELYDYVLNISETLEKLNPFILKKADELRNQNSGLREGFHSKGITSYDNVSKTVDDILDGTTSITDIDIGAITACLTQDNFKNENGVLCNTANMPAEEGCTNYFACVFGVDGSGSPICSACVFGVTDYSGRDNCASGTYSNCGRCYGGRNATMEDTCGMLVCVDVSGGGMCSYIACNSASVGITCSSSVTCRATVTCNGTVTCRNGNTKICPSGVSCDAGVSCETGVACEGLSCIGSVGEACSTVECSRNLAIADSCRTVSCSGVSCSAVARGECNSGDSCTTVDRTCVNCNVCEGCNNCNAGCNSCETCDGCNQCNSYAGCTSVGCSAVDSCTSDSVSGQSGFICKSGKGCVGDFAKDCKSFFK